QRTTLSSPGWSRIPRLQMPVDTDRAHHQPRPSPRLPAGLSVGFRTSSPALPPPLPGPPALRYRSGAPSAGGAPPGRAGGGGAAAVSPRAGGRGAEQERFGLPTFGPPASASRGLRPALACRLD